MDGHSTIRPFVLYRVRGAEHLCVEIRILHVLLVNSLSTLPRLHIKVYNAAKKVTLSTTLFGLTVWMEVKGHAGKVLALSDRGIAGLLSSGA